MVLPVDEAASNPGFFAFRARLQRTIVERDTAALLAVIDPEIKLSFGGDAGRENFDRLWFQSPENDEWSELGTVLALGGRFRGDSSFVAPYTFTAVFPGEVPADFDAFESLFVIGDAVRVYAAPTIESVVLASLSFRLVRHELTATDVLSRMR